jgi:hypothetical protein
MMDRDLTYDQLVEKYGERKMLTWGHDGEDALRLLELAIEWWELNLRVIEQAVREQEPNPFSQGYRRRHDLANASFQFRKSFNYDWSRGSAQPGRLTAET